MPIICKVCSNVLENDLLFNKHLKSHKITQCEYFQKYEPRYDRYDSSIILYKNKDYYFNTEFNSKTNFKKWLKLVPPETARAYIVNFLKQRKTKKNLTYAPTQAELRTLMLPGLDFIEKHIGSYGKICEEVGLKQRFTQGKLNESLFIDISKKVIFQDTREQKPLEFDNQTRTKGMNFGDYRLVGSSVRIERKSIADFWSSMTGGFKRFEREIIRAKEADSYLVILIEGTYEELENFPTQRQVRSKIRASIEFLARNMRELLYNYLNIQFLFVNGRDEASRVIQKIFSAGEQIKNLDLQKEYDIINL